MARQRSGLEGDGTRRLGKYELIARLGAGGMAAVYKAKDVETGRIVALKVLSPESAKPSWVRRFSREALTSARLNHPNIIDVYELNEADGIHFIAMEYVDGLNLDAYVTAKGKLNTLEALDITIQAARALQHAHEHGVVHRDVKPSNLLLSKGEGRTVIKLTDLGLAKDTLTEEQARLTKPGTALGTVDYIAPEQARGGHLADIRSDLYSLGGTLYYLLTGRPPFPGGTYTEKIYRQVHVMPADPRQFHPDLPESVLEVMGKLLQKKPEDRYQTPGELLIDLERAQHLLADPTANVLAGLSDGELVRGATRRAETPPPLPARWSPPPHGRLRVGGSSTPSAPGVEDAPTLLEIIGRGLAERWLFLTCAGLAVAFGIVLYFLLSE